MNIGLAQINATVGDMQNIDRILDRVEEAKEKGVELLLFPELAVCGYPPEDLLLREDFLLQCFRGVQRIAEASQNIVVLVGFPESDGRDVYNSLAVCADGEIQGTYRKLQLPNYGVFDEKRYFRAGDTPSLIEVNGMRIGLSICEDIWVPGAPVTDEALAGAELIVNLSASPYHRGKGITREAMLSQRARDNGVATAYVNLVGGQDELVFDGGSLVLDAEGRVVARGAQFEEELLVHSLDLSVSRSVLRQDARMRSTARLELPVLGSFEVQGTPPAPSKIALHSRELETTVRPAMDSMKEVYNALVLGVRDYVRKNGFKRVLLGLSGGIDSTLVAMVAADALGPENVTGIVMPSPYSTSGTQDDAHIFGERLGIDTREIRIAPMMESYAVALRDEFEDTEEGVTEENIQARIRGNLLMAMSNKFGWLLLTTGNKSEMSVGYATLYGDMAGGFAVIKDVPKLLVFALTEWRNHRYDTPEDTPVCPWSIITRPPSAELRPDQADTDSLPDYPILDPILEMYVERDLSLEEIVAQGYDSEIVAKVLRLVDLAEYKRRQAPPGIKITTRAFGRDRRLPLTNRFRHGTTFGQDSLKQTLSTVQKSVETEAKAPETAQ